MNKKILLLMLIICMSSLNVAVAQEEQTENTIYKTHDGRWIIENELEKGTDNYPYLIEDVGNNWKYTTDGNSIFIPKTFNIIESPTKISPCLTYSKITLTNNMVNHNETVAYLVFPYSLSNVKTLSNENNIKFGAWTFKAGTEHISIYDEYDNYLSPEYYEFKIVNDEIRLYFIKSEANLLSGNITFEMHSWILDGYTSFANSGQYFIDYDLTNLWIKDSIEAGGENIYIAEKTGSYSPNGTAVFDFYMPANSTDEWDTIGDSFATVNESYAASPLSSFKLDGSSSADFTKLNFDSISTGIIEFNLMKRDTIGKFDIRIMSDSTIGAYILLNDIHVPAGYSWYDGLDNSADDYSQSSFDALSIVKKDSNIYDFYVNHDKKISDDNGWNSISTMNGLYIYSSGSGCGADNYIDDLRIRKYVANEPTVNVIDKGAYYEIHVNSTDELADYQIGISGSELGIINSGESWNIYQSIILEVENLTATPYTENALIEWDDIPFADYYNVYRIEPSILFTNETLVLDGILDNAYSDIGQRGLLHTPNPEYVDQFDTIYALINDTYIFMYAKAHDDDTSSIDDSIEIYFDFTQNGLTIDDKGYIIKENEQIIEQEWTGSQWISGGATDADGVVLGSGTNNTDYELFIPLSELPELTYGHEIDLVVMHENTAVATTQSYFPLSAFSIANVTGWQNMFIENSSTAADAFLFNTTDNMFNLTGLESISWYRVGVSAVYVETESNITYVEFITQQYPEYYIDGYVIDLNTSVGIQNALVTVTDTFTSGFELTNGVGYYKFEGLRNDDYTLEASAVGYTTESISATVNNTDVTANNILLEFISYTMEEIYNKIEETNNNLESKILNLETKMNNLKMFILMSAMIVIGALYENKRRN